MPSDLRTAGFGRAVRRAFPGLPAALVSGRHLTWYGPSLAEAPARLRADLAAAAGSRSQDADRPGE